MLAAAAPCPSRPVAGQERVPIWVVQFMSEFIMSSTEERGAALARWDPKAAVLADGVASACPVKVMVLIAHWAAGEYRWVGGRTRIAAAAGPDKGAMRATSWSNCAEPKEGHLGKSRRLQSPPGSPVPPGRFSCSCILFPIAISYTGGRHNSCGADFRRIARSQPSNPTNLPESSSSQLAFGSWKSVVNQ